MTINPAIGVRRDLLAILLESLFAGKDFPLLRSGLSVHRAMQALLHRNNKFIVSSDEYGRLFGAPPLRDITNLREITTNEMA